MSGFNVRSLKIAESVFEHNQKREMEMESALKREALRREALIENMHRLKALRLAQSENTN